MSSHWQMRCSLKLATLHAFRASLRHVAFANRAQDEQQQGDWLAGSKQAYASLWHIEHLVSCIVDSSTAESLSSAPSRDLSVGVGGAVPTIAAIVLDPPHF
jgi:hypothetical protein